MTKQDKPWELYEQLYKNKWVRVSVDGISIIGVLSKANYENITLQPFIQHETISINDKELELRLEKDIPIVISMPIKVISPINEGFVKEFLKRYPIKHDSNQEELFL